MGVGIYLAGVVLTIISIASFQQGGAIGNISGLISLLGVFVFLIIELDEDKEKQEGGEVKSI